MTEDKAVYTANPSSLNSLRFIVENTTKISIKTNLLDYITERLVELNETLGDTEYDYCEQRGKIEELKQLADNINKIIKD